MTIQATLEKTERYVTSGAARLWSIVSGRGTPLLMFNGGPGCDDYLGPVADMIDDHCRVVRFEPRGCGRSDWDGNYDVDTLLTDAEKDIRPSWPTRQLASLMPRGRYVEIPDAAHVVWLTHATELEHELREAVREIVEST